MTGHLFAARRTARGYLPDCDTPGCDVLPADLHPHTDAEAAKDEAAILHREAVHGPYEPTRTGWLANCEGI